MPGNASRLAALALTVLACASGGGGERPEARAGGETLLDATAPAAARAGEPSERTRPEPGGAEGRPGRLLVYSAITGHVPLEDPAAAGPDSARTPAERELARAASLEAEIARELERQEQIEQQERGRAESALPVPAPEAAPEDPGLLAAPAAPAERDLPEALFSSERIEIAPGEWENARALQVERRSLDADRDGRPEELRYHDPRTGLLLRVEQDHDSNGRIDAWKTFAGGELRMRVLDRDGDGRPDSWERYEKGQLVQRTLDQDRDGVRDLFLHYARGELVERLEDRNGDGTIDRVVDYESKRRVRSEEDLTFNGAVDTWTHYAWAEGREVVARIERDTRDEGRADVVEIYETSGGETRLVRREEDLDRDGKIDVVSVFERGRLVRRVISDEALAPL